MILQNNINPKNSPDNSSHENPKTEPKKSTKKVITARRLKWLSLLFCVLAVVLIAISVVLHNKMSEHTVLTYSMGSYVQQRVYGADKKTAAQEAASMITELENTISWRVEGSDIEKLNLKSGGEFIEIAPVTYDLLLLCKDVSELSDGAFDVTIAPLSHLWNFDSGDEYIPDHALIDELLSSVNYKSILLDDGSAALKNKITALDLGGIGKGAACDTAVEIYKKHEVSGAIVACGGSIGAYGRKALGDSWKIAIRDPLSDDGSTSLGTLEIDEGFVSTSGNYEKSFTKDGTLYHHILDPHTGYPAASELTSVTVLGGSGALTDALATACFVLGVEDGKKLLAKYDAEGIFIDQKQQVFLTSGITEEMFTLSRITSSPYTVVSS